jgi:hypothetical protein
VLQLPPAYEETVLDWIPAMATVNFSDAEEWVDYYAVHAYSLGIDRPLPTLRSQLRPFAEKNIDKSILAFQESKQYRLTITAGALISGIPFPGSHILSKKLCTDSGVVAYAGKLLTLLGLADASIVGKLFKEALTLTNTLPEHSSWFAIITNEAKDYLSKEQSQQLHQLMEDLKSDTNVEEMVRHGSKELLGPTAAHEAQDLIHHMHLFGPVFKAMRGGSNAKARLDKAAGTLREKAIVTHQTVFIEVGLQRAR